MFGFTPNTLNFVKDWSHFGDKTAMKIVKISKCVAFPVKKLLTAAV